VTAPLSRLGACCASRITIRDPWTGDERCEFCGLPVPLPNVAGAALHGEESPLPTVEGGQGREPEDVVDDGDGIVRLVILACLGFAIVAVGVWAAGGGR